MKCRFIPTTEENVEETVNFVNSIGIAVTDKDLIEREFFVEFMQIPEFFKLYSLYEETYIFRISHDGVLFFVVLENARLDCENESHDNGGVVFCPMHNIKLLNLFGEITRKTAHE